MRFCPACGKPYPENARFCDSCGATLPTAEKPREAAVPVVEDDDEKTVFLGSAVKENKEEASSAAKNEAEAQPIQHEAVQPAAAPAEQTPVQTPVRPPVQAPVQPPVQAPVQPPVQAPVQPPMQTVVQPPMQTVVQPPMQAPVQSSAPAKKNKKPLIIAIIAIIAVVAVICAVVFGGSGDSGKSSGTNSGKSPNETSVSTEDGNDDGKDDSGKDDSGKDNGDKDDGGKDEGGASSGTSDTSDGDIKKAADGTTKFEDDDLSYVLIYNPAVYDERKSRDTTVRQTGDFSAAQVDVNTSRGDSLEETELPFMPMAAGSVDDGISLDLSGLDMNRAGIDGMKHSKGEKYEFGHVDRSGNAAKSEFECVYAGEYCYIWVKDEVSSSVIDTYGEAFDDKIYESVVDAFGEPRLVGDNGKINILLYYMPDNLGGFFRPYELFARSECSSSLLAEMDEYGINTDHAILHINLSLAEISSYETAIKGTLAHELQHLIYRSNSIDCDNTAVWLNEAMSGYIEEQLYSGGKRDMGHFSSFEKSDLIRYGQSLYNFGTSGRDIGVYGSVYYFTEYLELLTGSDEVFTDIHSYWVGLSDGTEAEALYESVSSSTMSEIDGLITYPSALKFASDEEEWISKLTLDFYLNLLSNDMRIPNHSEFDRSALVYDDLSGAEIEGGGRIILSVKDGEFDIPDDAENGLIYIGLDSDFNVITDYIYK